MANRRIKEKVAKKLTRKQGYNRVAIFKSTISSTLNVTANLIFSMIQDYDCQYFKMKDEHQIYLMQNKKKKKHQKKTGTEGIVLYSRLNLVDIVRFC